MVLYPRVEEKRKRRDKERLVKGSSPYIRAASMVGMCIGEESKDRRTKQAHHPLCSCEQKTPWLSFSLVRYLFLLPTKVHFCPYCPNCPIVPLSISARPTDRETCHRVQTTIVLLVQSNTVCRLNPRV